MKTILLIALAQFLLTTTQAQSCDFITYERYVAYQSHTNMPTGRVTPKEYRHIMLVNETHRESCDGQGKNCTKTDQQAYESAKAKYCKATPAQYPKIQSKKKAAKRVMN